MADTPVETRARLTDAELVDLDRRIQFAPGETYALLLRALTELRERRAAEEWRSITRFEAIDENGRAYVRWGVSVEPSFQDGGRTLKVFVRPAPPTREGGGG